jgi:hypothetical protein
MEPSAAALHRKGRIELKDFLCDLCVLCGLVERNFSSRSLAEFR